MPAGLEPPAAVRKRPKPIVTLQRNPLLRMILLIRNSITNRFVEKIILRKASQQKMHRCKKNKSIIFNIIYDVEIKYNVYILYI